MIRIYLDWNMISYLKRPEFADIKTFITDHRERFLFLYADAHFGDLMKSYSVDNPYFEQDLDMLDQLCANYFIGWEKERAVGYAVRPKDYFIQNYQNKDEPNYFDMDELVKLFDEAGDDIGMGELGKQFKELFSALPAAIDLNDTNREQLSKFFPGITEDSTQWDLFKASGKMLEQMAGDKEYYKDLRKSIADNGFDLGKNAGNWKAEDVIANIDAYLAKSAPGLDFMGYMNKAFSLRNEKPDGMTFFTSCYNTLDLLGFKTDKLPKKTDTPMNIQYDAQHAFFAGHCDFFVVADKNLAVKSKVLYSKFKLKTKIVSPQEMVEELRQVLHTPQGKPNGHELLKSALSVFNTADDRQDFPEKQTDGGEAYSKRLNVFFLDYFNLVWLQGYPVEKKIELTFYKSPENFLRFLYYAELETIIFKIAKYLGWTLKEDEIKECIRKNDPIAIKVDYDFGYILIDYEEHQGINQPTLTFGIYPERLQ